MIVIFLVVVAVILGVVLYGLLYQTGMLQGGSSEDLFPRIPRLAELPQGCLLTLIVVAGVWFLLWGIVLLLALRLLRSPLGG